MLKTPEARRDKPMINRVPLLKQGSFPSTVSTPESALVSTFSLRNEGCKSHNLNGNFLFCVYVELIESK